MQVLSDAVGVAARNRRNDVVEVQTRLRASHHSPGPIDGICGRRTIGAIVAEQRRFMPEPDGRVDVHGPTWRHLLTAAPSASRHPATPILAAAAPRPEAHEPPVPSRPTAVPVAPRPAAAPHPAAPVANAPSGELKYTDHLPLPARSAVNVGIVSPGNAAMVAKLGNPRNSYPADCAAVTNATFAAKIVTESVGPFRVTGYNAAVSSLRTVFAAVQRDHPDLYTQLGTAGMLCCRHVRGNASSISNHSFGCAIDMKVAGVLVPQKARYAIIGLQMLATYFNAEGWYWGAVYGVPDPQHFECGAALVASFA